MKNGLFKKSMSVFLSILMLLTCWVWVAPTEAEAAVATAYGMTTVTGTSKQDSTFKFVNSNSSSDYVQIKYPGTMYLDKTEDLQSVGYNVNISTNFGNGSRYTLLVFPSCRVKTLAHNCTILSTVIYLK